MFGLPRIQSIVAGGLLAIIVGLTVALFIANGNTRHWQKLDTLHSAQRDTEIAKNAVNLESITRLSDALDAKNAESEARAKSYADSKAADAATIADLDKRQKADAIRLETLRKLAADLPDNPACRVPAALSAQTGGL